MSRVEELEASIVSHFQREHLEGDGPEIDRWRAANAALVRALEDSRRAALLTLDRIEAGLRAMNPEAGRPRLGHEDCPRCGRLGAPIMHVCTEPPLAKEA